MKYPAGRFVLEVTAGYPVGLEIALADSAISFTHMDLMDLEHVVRRAKNIARMVSTQARKDLEE